MLTVVDLAKLELAGSVGTHEVSRLHTGMTASVRIEGIDTPVTGTIDRIAPAAEAGTRSIGVIVVVDNPKERCAPGSTQSPPSSLPMWSAGLPCRWQRWPRTPDRTIVWAIENGTLVRRSGDARPARRGARPRRGAAGNR